MGAQLMSDNAGQSAWIGTRDSNIHHLPFPYPWVPGNRSGAEFLTDALKRLADSGIEVARDIAGVMLETFQGWGAVFYPTDFVEALADLCRRHDIVFTFDEMQAGFARTGRKFGYEHYGVAPDLVCCGKGMASGLPLSGVLGRAEIMDLPEIGTMSSTHSGNPLACVAGLATIEEIERLDLVNEAARKGAILFDRLAALQRQFPRHISHCLGKGLIAAVLFAKRSNGVSESALASRVSERAMEKGLLVIHTGRESIKNRAGADDHRRSVDRGHRHARGSYRRNRGGDRGVTAQLRHTGIVVSDLDAALHFYGELLGFETVRRAEESGAALDNILALDGDAGDDDQDGGGKRPDRASPLRFARAPGQAQWPVVRR